MYLEIFLYSVLLLFFFLILLKSSDYIIDIGSVIGLRFGLSKLFIGLTIIAFGTSLPELITSIASLFGSQGNSSSFIIGTILGSNIANSLLILGIFLVLIKKIRFKVNEREVLFLLFSTILLGILLFIGNIDISLSLFLLSLFIYYIYLIFKNKDKELEETVEQEEGLNKKFLKKSLLFLFGLFLLSSFFLGIGGRGIIFSIEKLSVLLNLDVSFLSLTSVALATSLPEIIVTIKSFRKKELALGIGNILGSNITNILLIFGLVGFFNIFLNVNLFFQNQAYMSSYIVLLIVTLILSLMLYFKKEFTFRIGILFIISYISHIIFIF